MKIFEWLGSLMMVVALVEFVPNPKKAIQSITGVLQTNVRMDGNHLAVHHGGKLPAKRKSGQ